MAEAAEKGSAHRDVKAELDERRIARGVAMGLPLITVSLAAIVGVTIGAPMAILVLASGTLLGVIALFWASLRILSGDAAISPELEALDATAHAVDALATRKTMLLRALKDLDNERALGKLEEEDHAQLSQTYRAELREVLARIDASLEPHRPKAEDAARAYLAKAGIAEPVADEDDDEEDEDDSDEDDSDEDESEPEPAIEKVAEAAAKVVNDKKKVAAAKPAASSARTECAACKTSNEVDASFCKKCGASLAKTSAADVKEEASDEA